MYICFEENRTVARGNIGFCMGMCVTVISDDNQRSSAFLLPSFEDYRKYVVLFQTAETCDFFFFFFQTDCLYASVWTING